MPPKSYIATERLSLSRIIWCPLVYGMVVWVG